MLPGKTTRQKDKLQFQDVNTLGCSTHGTGTILMDVDNIRGEQYLLFKNKKLRSSSCYRMSLHQHSQIWNAGGQGGGS